MFGKNWLSKSRDIHILVIRIGQKILPIFCSKKMVQLAKKFILDFWSYFSNAVKLRHGSCAKMISSIRRLQPRPQWFAMTIIMNFDVWMPRFCLYSFCIGCFTCTRTTLSNIFYMVLGTIWHEKVKGGFHSKGISCKPQLYLQRL